MCKLVRFTLYSVHTPTHTYLHTPTVRAELVGEQIGSYVRKGDSWVQWGPGRRWIMNSLATAIFCGVITSDLPFPSAVCIVVMESSQGREASQGRTMSESREDGSPAQVPKGGKLGRIAGHTQGLVEDLREWIDLRLDLAILEMEEKVDALRNEVALGVTLAFFGFFAALFGFTTVALGLGWLLGHPFWGFLIVSVVLLLVVTALAKARPDLVPPSNLFKRIRGRTEEDAERPVRDASATVADEEET